MNELLDSIKKHLGTCVAVNQLNHYSLLGITRDASLSEIKLALRSAVAAWNASDTKTDPEAARLVAKLIKQAQADLLDASSKQEYDEQLRRRAASSNQSFFPQADPFAPFDPNAYLVGAGISSSIHSFGSASERWNELKRQIPALAEAPPVTHLNESAALDRSEPLASKFRRLKRKRKLKQGLYMAGFLAVAVSFLGYAGLRFVWNRLEIGGRLDTTRPLSSPSISFTKPNSPIARTIGGKNAPKANSNDPAFVFPTLANEEASVERVVEPLIPDAMPAPMKTVSAMPMVPAASATSNTEWIKAMTKAKESIDKADFATFHEQIRIALPLSTTDEMQSKHARLDQLGQLYEIFIKSVREAKSKMRGAETFLVGKLQVGVVEINNEVLIVRIQGKNERFDWDRLPPGIAIAMADLTLSEQEPTDIAARAVYFSLSPARNELFEKKVTDWFEKSVGKGTIRKDLVQALSDTYE